MYAGLAFYLLQEKLTLNIFVTSSVMFLIFSVLPFSFQQGIQYAWDGLIVFAVFVGVYFLFDYSYQKETKEIINIEQQNRNHITAINAVLSLTLAWIISGILTYYYPLSHLYWIELTVLVVIQGSQQGMISTALKRILVNAFGALMIVILFNYVLPPDFWLNFSVLVIFLFLIFCLSFSYVGRTLFVELFVLGFTHLLGDYQNAIALDRVILTLIGGLIVICMTPISYYLGSFIDQNRLNKFK